MYKLRDMDIEQMLKNPQLNQFIFYPRKTPKPENKENRKSIELKVEKNLTTGVIFHIKDKNFPTIFMFHGNGEVATDYDSIATRFLSFGVNLAVFDYRGYGFSEGRASYYHLIKDSPIMFQRMHTYLEDNGFRGKIIVFGRSLGSAAAAEIGKHNPNSAMGYIFESGYSDTFSLMRTLFSIDLPEMDQKQRKKWSNAEKIGKIKRPILVIHGTSDNIIPYRQGKEIYKAALNAKRKKMITIKNAGHNSIMMFEEQYFPPIEQFIDEIREESNLE